MLFLGSESSGPAAWLAQVLLSFLAITSDYAWYITSSEIAPGLMRDVNCTALTPICIRAARGHAHVLWKQQDDIYWAKVAQAKAAREEEQAKVDAEVQRVKGLEDKALELERAKQQIEELKNRPTTTNIHQTINNHFTTNNNFYNPQFIAAPSSPCPTSPGYLHIGGPPQNLADLTLLSHLVWMTITISAIACVRYALQLPFWILRWAWNMFRRDHAAANEVPRDECEPSAGEDELESDDDDDSDESDTTTVEEPGETLAENAIQTMAVLRANAANKNWLT